MTDARWRTIRSSAGIASRRASRSALTVGGMSISPISPTASPLVVLADEQAVVDEHPEDLLDEQRIALGGVGDADSCRAVEPTARQQVLDDVVAVVARERCKRDRLSVRIPGAPTGATVEELGPSSAHDEDRGPGAPSPQVLQQVEERRLAPVDVVEGDDEGADARGGLEQLADGPERLLNGIGRVRQTDDRCDVGGDRRGVGIVIAEPSLDLCLGLVDAVVALDASQLPDDLRHRPERDPLAIREAATARRPSSTGRGPP